MSNNTVWLYECIAEEYERNAKLIEAISRIDAINDNPAKFSSEINEICDSILRQQKNRSET